MTDRRRPCLTVLVGCPASGKSTHAATARAASPGVFVSNRDGIRLRLFSDGYAGHPRDAQREDLVTQHQLAEVHAALHAGREVLVDDTNLDPQVRDAWAKTAGDFGADFRVLTFDVPLETALERNARRLGGARVPDQVLRDMHRLAAEQLRTLVR